MRQSTRRIIVRPDRPCQVCGAGEKCSIGEDGFILCRGKSGEQPGFSYHGQSKKDPQWGQYRVSQPGQIGEGTGPRRGSSTNTGRKRSGEEKSPARHWIEKAMGYVPHLTPARSIALAEHLGLPLASLECIAYLGSLRESAMGSCWTFPQWDGQGECIGVLKRPAQGDPQLMAGSKGGLNVNRLWEEIDGPLYIVEGVSDVIALHALGLAGVGRHSAKSGVDHLVALMRDLNPARSIIVMGEWDQNEKGGWPGRDGAEYVAGQLAQQLQREVYWALPPNRSKDVRVWCNQHCPDPADADLWFQEGQRFASSLRLNSIQPPAVAAQAETNKGGLVTTRMSTVKPSVIRWLVPGYFPKGELHLFGADSTMGKSMVMFHVAAQLSRGEPCFGLDYPTYAPVDSLIFNCEDRYDKTSLPRLQSLRADMGRIEMVDGFKDNRGETLRWSLANLTKLEEHLRANSNIGLVVIDPIDSYVFGTGVDDFRANSLRALVVDPLVALAERYNCVVMMILHLNKGESKKAVNRLANSIAYYTGSRVGYMAFYEPGQEERRVFSCEKINGSAKPVSLLYRIVTVGPSLRESILQTMESELDACDLHDYGKQLVVAEWLGETELNGDACCAYDVMIEPEDQFGKDKAAAWLRSFLASGPRPMTECLEEGNRHLGDSHNDKWWRDKVLVPKCSGRSRRDGKAGKWFWCLPGQNLQGKEQEGQEDQEGQEARGS